VLSLVALCLVTVVCDGCLWSARCLARHA
jgi:hypothetical protein